MKVSEFKDIADALARFATTRETSTGPESKIGVQVSNDRLKLISGSDVAGMVVDAMPHDGRFSYAIDARPFLQSAKVLPARQEVGITAYEDRLEITAEGGGKVELKATARLSLVGYAKKPKEFVATASIYGEKFAQISKLFKAVAGKIEVPSIQVNGDKAIAVAVAPGNRPTYAAFETPCVGPDGYNAAGYRDFWEALRILEADGELMFGRDGLLARSGKFECYSGPYLVSRYDANKGVAETPREPPAWPILKRDGLPHTSFTMPRRDLITVIKGQAPFDTHNRITLQVDTEAIKVSAFGSDVGQQLPAQTSGQGIRSVRADYLSGLLSSMDARLVTLGWGGGSPAVSIIAEEYSGWTVLLAPVTV